MDVRTTPLDIAAAQPHMRGRMRAYADKIDLRIISDDGMESDDVHYLLVGASALDAILSAVRLGDHPGPARILDFGSGAGRVTRWLKVAYPAAQLCCCDLRSQDLMFCREVFQADTWVSGTDVNALDLKGQYDLIWMGSVLTHLEENVARRLVDKLMGALNPGGLLVATTIGRAARAIQDESPIFLEGKGWLTVKLGYDRTGYGYIDYDNQQGYGLSLSSLAWVTSLASRHSGRKLVMLSEAAWDGTQDVFALQVDLAFKGDPMPSSPLGRETGVFGRRMQSFESSIRTIAAPWRRWVKMIRR